MTNQTGFSDPPALLNIEALAFSPVCYYIPVYQQQIAWGKADVERFLEGVVGGVGNFLTAQSDTATFIGAMTFYNDENGMSVMPRLPGDLPHKIHHVVDGQQRLTAIMVICACLHDYLRGRTKRLNDGAWLKEMSTEVGGELKRVLEYDAVAGGPYPYPKMIRAHTDTWSKKRNSAVYASPLAAYLSGYCTHVRLHKDAAGFKYEAGDLPKSGLELSAHTEFSALVRCAKRMVAEICGAKSKDNLALPEIEDARQCRNLLHILFTMDELGADQFGEGNRASAEETFRALLLARYILKRVYAISLVALREEYAFDIFESLNTTGVELTAIETFKPEVVQSEGIGEFQASPSGRYFNAIDDFFDRPEVKRNSSARVAREIVKNFALAESGETPPGNLGGQRAYLRGAYQRISDPAGKREFVRHLKCVTDVVRYFWDECANPSFGVYAEQYDPAGNELLLEERKAAFFGLNYLRDVNHTVSRALMARFHYAITDNSNNDAAATGEIVRDFFRSVKAMAALFALWRATRNGTDGIAECYARLFRGEMKDLQAGAFSRKQGGSLAFADVRQSLEFLLTRHGGNSGTRITTRQEFIDRCLSLPIYEMHKKTAKFLLLVASHDAIPTEDRPWILKRGVRGCYSVIGRQNWSADECAEIEHIVPRSQEGAGGYASGELDRLGNLTLIPAKDNKFLGKKNWNQRQKIYAIQSAESREERKRLIDEADFLSDDARDYFQNDPRYLRMTKGVARWKEFGGSAIKERGENIAGLAWDILAEDWLGLKSSD
jgi:hypothetical protein